MIPDAIYKPVFLLGRGECFLSIDRTITIMNPFTNRRVNLKTWRRISNSHIEPIMIRKRIFDISCEISELKNVTYQHRFLLACATSSSLVKIMSISENKERSCLSKQVDFLISKHARRLDGIAGTQPIPSFPNPIQHKFHISERPSIPTQLDDLCGCVKCTGESESCALITNHFLQTSTTKRSNAPTQFSDKNIFFSNHVSCINPIHQIKYTLYNKQHYITFIPNLKFVVVHSSFWRSLNH